MATLCFHPEQCLDIGRFAPNISRLLTYNPPRFHSPRPLLLAGLPSQLVLQLHSIGPNCNANERSALLLSSSFCFSTFAFSSSALTSSNDACRVNASRLRRPKASQEAVGPEETPALPRRLSSLLEALRTSSAALRPPGTPWGLARNGRAF